MVTQPPTRKKRPRPASDLPSEISDIGEGLSKYTSILIFGDPGSGKTPLALTAPNPIVLECDRGLKAAAVAKARGKKWVIDDYNDLTKAYEYMRNGGCRKFDWLIMDSLTMFQDRGLDHIMDDLHAEKPHRQVWAADRGEYGQNMNRISRFIRDLVALPINVIVTCTAMVHEVERPDGTTVTSYWPTVKGVNMPQKIASYFDIVAHLQQVPSKTHPDQDYPVLSTRRRDGWYARDRFAVIGRMPRPTMPKVIAAIEASKGETPDTTTKGE
jgi:AAA domain